jgi:hypothetical protein
VRSGSEVAGERSDHVGNGVVGELVHCRVIGDHRVHVPVGNDVPVHECVAGQAGSVQDASEGHVPVKDAHTVRREQADPIQAG